MTARRRGLLLGLALAQLLLMPIHVSSLVATGDGIPTVLPVLALVAGFVTVAAVVLVTFRSKGARPARQFARTSARRDARDRWD